MAVTNALGKLILCLVPLALTPLWLFLISESYLNFGGGDKDVVLLIPWVLWATLYLVFFVVAWSRRLETKTILRWSVGGATAVLAVVWAILFVWFSGLLGVGG